MRGVLRAAALAGWICLPFTAHATVLTFDFGGVTGAPVPQEYGDNVNALTQGGFNYGSDGGFTPHVAVSYFGAANNDLQYWSTGFNDLEGVVFNPVEGADGFTLNFRAEPGFRVALERFELGNRSPFDAVLPGVIVTNEVGQILFSATDVDVNFAGGDHLNFGFGPDNLVASEINLFIATGALGGRSDDIGLDNIRFSQVDVSAVPLPPALGLFGVALLALGWRRRQG